MIFWRLSVLVLLLSPAAAVAAPSLCAHLPETGSIAAAAPPELMPPKPRADRSLICPPGWRLDVSGRLPACVRPGQRAIAGNPRAACRASLALGPVAAVPPQWRPTRSCPGGAISAVLRLEGVNVGLADVAVSSASPGVTVASLDEDTAGLAAAERPSARGCFAHQCRLLRIGVAYDAPDEIRLDLRIADGAATMARIPVITHCPDPVPVR
ncbi:MAG: hypothetical protein ACOYO0_03720 [Sandarakinorhabdus sp.]